MFRKSHIILKLLILTFAVLAAWCGMDVILRNGFIALGETKSGLRVEIDEVKTDLAEGDIRIKGLKFSKPGAVSEQVFTTVDSAYFHISIGNLARRRYLIKEGILDGIHIEIDGSGGFAEFDTEAARARLSKKYPLIGQALTGKDSAILLLSGSPKEAAFELTRDFEISKLGNRIAAEWKQDSEKIKADAKSIESHINQLQTLIEKGSRDGNLLRKIQEFLVELDSIDRESAELKNSISALAKKGTEDQAALKRAVELDRGRLENLRPPKPDPREFTETLFGQEICELLESILAKAAQCENFSVIEEPPLYDEFGRGIGFPRLRGTDVFFAGKRSRPELFIRSLKMNGDLRMGDDFYHFAGFLKDVSNRPEAFASPMYLHFGFSGEPVDEERLQLFASEIDGVESLLSKSFELENPHTEKPEVFLTLMIDRTGEIPHTRLLAVMPKMSIPDRVLGNEKSLSIDVSPGDARMVVVLDQRGEELTGELRYIQSPVRIRTNLPQDVRIDPALLAGISEFDKLEIGAEISGTRERPQVTIRSDIGEQISRQWEQALQSRWDTIMRETVGELNLMHSDSVRLLDTQIRNELQPLSDSLSSSRNRLERELKPGIPNIPGIEIPGVKIPDEEKIRSNLLEGLRKVIP